MTSSSARARSFAKGSELRARAASYLRVAGIESVARLASFLSIVAFGAGESPEQLGRFAVALTAWSAYGQVSTWGSERSAYLWDPERALSEVVRLRLRSGLVGALATTLLLAILDLGAYSPAIWVAYLFLLADCEFEHRRQSRWARAGLPRLAGSLVLLGAVLLGAPGPVAVALMAGAQLGAAVALRVALRHTGRWGVAAGERPDAAVSSRVRRREMLFMGSTSVVWPIIYSADQLLLAGSRGYAAAAEYVIAYRLLMPMISLFAFSQSVHVPRLGTPEGFHQYRAFNRGICAVAVLGAGGLAAAAATLGHGGIAVILLALSPQLAVIAVTDPIARALAVRGRAGQVLGADLGALALSLALYASLIPWLGVAGAVLATLLTHLGYWALLHRVARGGRSETVGR